MKEQAFPLIVGFVTDLMFQTKIENVARGLGYRVEWIEQAGTSGEGSGDQQERPGEMLHGQGGRLFEQITQWQPALLIFDLGNQSIPWQVWLPALKSSPATRRIPAICYGPHVDVELLETAQSLGADTVVPRSRFSSRLPQLIQEHARYQDMAGFQTACAEPLAVLARQGIEQFNQGHYYKAHDDLEEAWQQDESPARELYRGILQVGIAYFQIERGNYRGAAKMLLRVRQWLEPLPAVCRGVDVARLREDVENVHDSLVTLGPERMDELNRALFRPVRLVEDA